MPVSKSGYTATAIILDRSGSMSSIRSEVLKGLRKLASDHANLPGSISFDLISFDDTYSYELRGVSADEFGRKVDLNPGGSTALYDAVVRGIAEFRTHLDQLDDDDYPEYIQVVVATDGQENASKVANGQMVADTVEYHAQNLGWDFTFLGSNQDAILTGAKLGFEGKKSLTFGSTASGVQGATASLSDYLAQTRSGVDAGYADAHRSASGH